MSQIAFQLVELVLPAPEKSVLFHHITALQAFREKRGEVRALLPYTYTCCCMVTEVPGEGVTGLNPFLHLRSGSLVPSGAILLVTDVSAVPVEGQHWTDSQFVCSRLYLVRQDGSLSRIFITRSQRAHLKIKRFFRRSSEFNQTKLRRFWAGFTDTMLSEFEWQRNRASSFPYAAVSFH